MAKSLAEIIMETFPAATFGPLGNVSVQDNTDGKGPFIAKWDEAAIGAPKPDAAQLVADYQAAHPGE